MTRINDIKERSEKLIQAIADLETRLSKVSAFLDEVEGKAETASKSVKKVTKKIEPGKPKKGKVKSKKGKSELGDSARIGKKITYKGSKVKVVAVDRPNMKFVVEDYKGNKYRVALSTVYNQTRDAA